MTRKNYTEYARRDAFESIFEHMLHRLPEAGVDGKTLTMSWVENGHYVYLTVSRMAAILYHEFFDEEELVYTEKRYFRLTAEEKARVTPDLRQVRRESHRRPRRSR